MAQLSKVGGKDIKDCVAKILDRYVQIQGTVLLENVVLAV